MASSFCPVSSMLMQLVNMQRAFATRLRRMRWNNIEGYQKTERYRHMVEDVLQLDQGFVDLALHPLVKKILNALPGNELRTNRSEGLEVVTD